MADLGTTSSSDSYSEPELELELNSGLLSCSCMREILWYLLIIFLCSISIFFALSRIAFLLEKLALLGRSPWWSSVGESCSRGLFDGTHLKPSMFS